MARAMTARTADRTAACEIDADLRHLGSNADVAFLTMSSRTPTERADINKTIIQRKPRRTATAGNGKVRAELWLHSYQILLFRINLVCSGCFNFNVGTFVYIRKATPQQSCWMRIE